MVATNCQGEPSFGSPPNRCSFKSSAGRPSSDQVSAAPSVATDPRFGDREGIEQCRIVAEMRHVPRLPVRCARLRRGGAAPRQARASSFPASAARVRHASSPPIRRARVSRPRSPPISWRCSMPSRSPKRWSVATIGAAAPAASCRRSGRNGWSRSSPEICGMGALQAVKMALGITTLADSQEDISCHVLRFRTERL